MPQEYTYHGLIKIGKSEHIDQLQKEGLIHSKTLQYFRNKEIEDFKLRRDISEGAISSTKLTSLELFVDGKKLPLDFIKGRLNTFDPSQNHTHIFCLYSISNDFINGKPFVDDRNIKFGDSALIILNPKEFIRRIEQNTIKKFKIKYEPVSYYEEDGSYENLTIFQKPSYFKYQNEFRFHFDIIDENDLEFKIGSIEDISMKIDSDKLSKLTIRSESA